MGFDGNMAMNGAVDLGELAQQVQPTRQIIDMPIHTEAAPNGPDGMEINFLVMDGPMSIAPTYRIGRHGIESLRAALAAIDGVPDA